MVYNSSPRTVAAAINNAETTRTMAKGSVPLDTLFEKITSVTPTIEAALVGAPAASNRKQGLAYIFHGCALFLLCTASVVPMLRARQERGDTQSTPTALAATSTTGSVTLTMQPSAPLAADRIRPGSSFAELIREVCARPKPARKPSPVSAPTSLGVPDLSLLPEQQPPLAPPPPPPSTSMPTPSPPILSLPLSPAPQPGLVDIPRDGIHEGDVAVSDSLVTNSTTHGTSHTGEADDRTRDSPENPVAEQPLPSLSCPESPELCADIGDNVSVHSPQRRALAPDVLPSSTTQLCCKPADTTTHVRSPPPMSPISPPTSPLSPGRAPVVSLQQSPLPMSPRLPTTGLKQRLPPLWHAGTPLGHASLLPRSPPAAYNSLKPTPRPNLQQLYANIRSRALAASGSNSGLSVR